MSPPNAREIRRQVAVEEVLAASEADEIPGTSRPIQSHDSAGVLVESPFATMLGLHDSDTEVKCWIDTDESIVIAKIGEDVDDWSFDDLDGGD